MTAGSWMLVGAPSSAPTQEGFQTPLSCLPAEGGKMSIRPGHCRSHYTETSASP